MFGRFALGMLGLVADIVALFVLAVIIFAVFA